MKLELITLTGTKVDQDIYEVVIPTKSGEIGVFPGHERLVTLAVPGVVRIRHKKSEAELTQLAINGGVVEIAPDHVRILVDEAESAEEIVASEAQAAYERAKKQRDLATDQLSVNEAEAIMNRQAARIKIADLRRHHR